MDSTLFQYWGKELLSIFILLPLLWYFVKNSTNETKRRSLLLEKGFKDMTSRIENMNKKFLDKFEKHEEADNKYMKDLTQALNHHDENFNKSMNRLMLSMGNTVLNKEQTINLLLTNMWFVSYNKLQFIKNTLIVNHIYEREVEVKSLIKTELIRQSETYMKTFNEYLTPAGNVREWLNKNFDEKDFEEFLEKIYNVVFTRKYNKFSNDARIELKINDIRNIMKTLQNELSAKLRKFMDSMDQ